jgi:biofilm PGA synthesis N-glycosyltransferase PgaC
MIVTIQVIWFLCLFVVTAYHLFVFQSKRKSDLMASTPGAPGVSVIIAVHNNSERLRENLEGIIHQHYPKFDINIVDDRSDGGERKTLEELIHAQPSVKLWTSERAGKKQALWTGIKNAKYDVVLFTDADCTPASMEWISMMVRHGPDIVIGYSPYLKIKGWLNRIIRFETVMTGIQYLSWAMKGRPYMSVGRNVMYPRSLFISSDPFSHHRDIPYGDDDLGLQFFSGKPAVSVCMEKNAHIISMPATSWLQWLKQKHRHLSAGHYYKTGLWWQPGLYGIALIAHWLLLAFVADSIMWWRWLPIFVLSMLIRWFTYYRWASVLGDKDTVWWYPLLEIIYTAYLALMGSVTAIAKKKTWN